MDECLSGVADDALRVYLPEEAGPDGYPAAWHKGDPPIKDLIRARAGHRCLRCLHPFTVGESGEWAVSEKWVGPESSGDALPVPAKLFEGVYPILAKKSGNGVLWSDCDPACRHGGPMRAMTTTGWEFFHPTPEACGAAVAAVAPSKMQASWRILTVHHLTGQKLDCRWWNLCALCQRCHLTIQKKVNMAQVWPREHSDWFKPYAAGFYASTYLKQEISRAEAEDRLEELLALERQDDEGVHKRR